MVIKNISSSILFQKKKIKDPPTSVTVTPTARAPLINTPLLVSGEA